MFSTKSITEASLFLVVFIVYYLCLSNTINFWDSPEFIISNATLQPTHPPGAPLYTLFSSFVLSFFSLSKAALITNIISSFFGALTVFFVFKIIYFLSLLTLNGTEEKEKNTALFSGLLGALSLAFSTSYWTVSIEAEVYTMSFSLMSVIIYLMLLWYKEHNQKTARRQLLLIAFLIGISIGVHAILVSITIPFAILFVFKSKPINFKNFAIAIVAGLVGFVILYGVIFKGIISMFSKIDIYSVNQLKLPLNYGAFISFIVLLITLLCLQYFFAKKQWHQLRIIGLLIILFIAGSSSYLMPILRAESNTLVSEKVNSANRLKNYISAKRFGVDNIPLIYGPYYSAQLSESRPFINTDEKMVYDDASKSYIVSHNGISGKVNYSEKFKTIFPRMYDASNANNYAAWTTIKGESIPHKVKDEIVSITKPKFSENIGFFINYQVKWLNLRYLFWNFIGRQNDIHGLGYIKNGNWKSGINAIDKSRIGDSALTPKFYKKNKANDSYYFLPFILGLIGLIGLFKNKVLGFFLLMVFLCFGIGITIYVNPLPSSILVRERDYIFLGSFVIFCIWIGLSLSTIINAFQNKISSKISTYVITAILLIVSPIQLFAKGWDNHQNRDDYFAYNFGKAYLDSCPQQAILITNGDNMTFPLWYLQEIKGYRKDVRVVNFDQLNIDSNVDRLKIKKLESKPIALDLDKEIYAEGIEKLLPFKKDTDQPIDLEILTKFLNDKKTRTEWNGRARRYIPGQVFQTKADSAFFSNSLKNSTYSFGVKQNLTWSLQKDFYALTDIVMLNIIKNNINKRPICFAINGHNNHFVGLENSTIQNGLVALLTPQFRTDKNVNPKLVNTEKTFNILVKNNGFKSFNSEKQYIKDENRTYAREILRPQYYFLAQALIEEGKKDKAKETLDKCLKLFPNSEVPFKQFAFAMGKLYHKLNDTETGNSVCKIAMTNYWQELAWITSFDTPNPIINVRHAVKLHNNYLQMLTQYKSYNPKYVADIELKLKNFETKFKIWQQNNWPY